MSSPSPEALLAAIQALSFARTLDELTSVVRTHARAVTGADGIAFVLRDAGECYYVDEDAIGPLWKGRRFPLEACISGWVMLYGQPALIPDIYTDPRIQHDAYRPTFVRSLAMFPVRTEAPIAAIGAYWATIHEATEPERNALQALAHAASLALANAQLYSDLRTAIASERQARESAESANRLRDEFLATLSHELRTPLNVIRGWLWALDGRTEAPGELRRRAVEAIEHNVGLQVRLIEDLLDTSSGITGKLTIDRRLVDLNDVSRAVVNSLRAAARGKSLSLTIEAESAPLMLMGDADRLRQILWNVVSNAVKFTPAGGSVRVAATRQDCLAELTVRDTGVGISSEFLPYVFDRFRQGEGGSTRRFGGLGLGLSIVRQLVDLHGGSVSAMSDGPDTGTTVTIAFPVAAVLDDTAVKPAEQARLDIAPRLSGIKVVVADDDTDAGEAVKCILEQHGAAVWTVTSGEEALAIVNEHQPNVLLADLSMPGLDGFALIRCIRMLSGPSAHLPAAAFSGLTAAQHRHQAQQAGYQGYLEKPVAPHALTAEVARLAALSTAGPDNGSSSPSG